MTKAYEAKLSAVDEATKRTTSPPSPQQVKATGTRTASQGEQKAVETSTDSEIKASQAAGGGCAVSCADSKPISFPEATTGSLKNINLLDDNNLFTSSRKQSAWDQVLGLLIAQAFAKNEKSSLNDQSWAAGLISLVELVLRQ